MEQVYILYYYYCYYYYGVFVYIRILNIKYTDKISVIYNAIRNTLATLVRIMSIIHSVL